MTCVTYNLTYVKYPLSNRSSEKGVKKKTRHCLADNKDRDNVYNDSHCKDVPGKTFFMPWQHAIVYINDGDKL